MTLLTAKSEMPKMKILAYYQIIFEFRKNDFSSIPEVAVNTGVELF